MPSIGIPAMHGYLGWTNDPAVTSVQSTAQPAGVMNHQMVYLQQGMVISNISVVVQTAGTILTNCYLGLYSSTAQLAITGNLSSSWTTAGLYKHAIASSPGGAISSYTIPTTGYYWVALLVGGSTISPRFMGPTTGNGTTTAANAGLSASLNTLTLRYGQFSSSLTALPASISGTPTPGASYVFWAGLN